ncbi:hypothetical protein K435DRAFT_761179 [Dendrothele bispora CBS 962.96]|uniref:Shikimate dehydrogenase substrate binding N-terminal domain-containing protein n=1 Tax=Dendrothele bispora (strain CBS 962.96) TaxID=1314807 RepID=A0A4S8LJZ0_DENBC|nr:hypothetical protein K435DRAFT_761179 [Dendrothele bispora CBS 962.96]
MQALLPLQVWNNMGNFSSSSTDSPDGKSFRLFGYPLAHSASPAFHNEIFKAMGTDKHYSIYSTSKVIPGMLDEIRSDNLGGAAVTMPLKSAIIPYLDGISPESQATGAVNTLVKVPSPSENGTCSIIGTNTDILGVKNALLKYLRQQHPDVLISNSSRYPENLGGAGVVFGGGATTRSAVYALHTIGLHPIYLVNRDVDEVAQVRANFPDLVKAGSLVHLTSPTLVEELLAQPTSPKVLMIVGAIPAIAPKTKEERMVYTTASHILTIPYEPPVVPEGSVDSLPIPMKRLFLEMAYKPRLTPMLQVATAHGWEPIVGTEAMLEQGYAQQRMWIRGDPSMATGSDPTILGEEVEKRAADLIAGLGDIVVKEAEIDRAASIGAAPIPKLN